MRAFLKRFEEILSKLDAGDSGEAMEEFCAELEDAIFLLECAEDAEEVEGALEEISGLADELRALGEAERAAELSATAELARENVQI